MLFPIDNVIYSQHCSSDLCQPLARVTSVVLIVFMLVVLIGPMSEDLYFLDITTSSIHTVTLCIFFGQPVPKIQKQPLSLTSRRVMTTPNQREQALCEYNIACIYTAY